MPSKKDAASPDSETVATARAARRASRPVAKRAPAPPHKTATPRKRTVAAKPTAAANASPPPKAAARRPRPATKTAAQVKATISDPEISISIVSYNTRELLRACLSTLQERQAAGEANLEIIVADNDSHDGSAEMVEAEFPAVRLVRSGGNIGYGRANNLALEAARGRYFFVLNSDTRVEAGALAAMRDFMDEHPQVGAAGAQLVLPDGAIQPSCARDPHLLPVLWEQTYLDKLLPSNPITGAYLMTDWDYQGRREVEQVCGACLFARREAYRQIAGFDPAYFMYFEDTDFCIRLRRAGWLIYFVPEARITHQLGASSSSTADRARMVASYNRSRYYYFTRQQGPRHGAVLKLLTVSGALLRLLTWTALTLLRRGDARRDALEKLRLFRIVLRQTVAMTADAPLAAAIDD